MRGFFRDHHSPKDVEFRGGSGVAVAGVFGGVTLALGGTWILLSHAQALDPKVTTLLVIVCLVLGGLVALTSAFFGLVVPRHVHRGPLKPGDESEENEP